MNESLEDSFQGWNAIQCNEKMGKKGSRIVVDGMIQIESIDEENNSVFHGRPPYKKESRAHRRPGANETQGPKGMMP